MFRTGHRHLHKDFVLSCNPKKTVDGRFQASLAITYLGGERTRSQRFIDMADVFDTEEEAAEHARTVGVEWIERQISGG